MRASGRRASVIRRRLSNAPASRPVSTSGAARPGCRASRPRVATRRALSVVALSLLAPALAPALGAQGTDSARAAAAGAQGVTQSAAPAAQGAAQGAPQGAAQGAPQGGAARDSTPPSPADIQLQRERSLVAQGQVAAARALVDSVLAAAPVGSMTYASALYDRATLATSADSAEADYRRLTVDYPDSPRATDALLQLAQLELARGDRDQAAAHLDRITREQLPGQTGLQVARLDFQVGLAYFDLQDAARACAALAAARAAAPTTDVELRNRIDYNIGRCPRPAPPGSALANAPSPPASPSSPPAADSARRSGAHGAAPQGPRPSGGRRLRTPGYTVQVAAYPTHAAAAALVQRLSGRGYVARIDGTTPPFRVRIGRFATEAQADSAARSLARKGLEGFVTGAEPIRP